MKGRRKRAVAMAQAEPRRGQGPQWGKTSASKGSQKGRREPAGFPFLLVFPQALPVPLIVVAAPGKQRQRWSCVCLPGSCAGWRVVPFPEPSPVGSGWSSPPRRKQQALPDKLSSGFFSRRKEACSIMTGCRRKTTVREKR